MFEGTPLTIEEIERLRQFDSPTISNVIELFEVRPRTAGYMDGRIRANFPEMPAIAGYAATLSFRSADPPRAQDASGGIDQHLILLNQMPSPQIVVIQDLDDPPAAACFGEIMCSTYQAFGCVGLITNGAGRDLDQVRAMKFPVFTSQTICSHGYCHLLDFHTPVRVGGLTVKPGELIHADRNGVVVIPGGIAKALGRACEEFLAAEKIVLDALGTKSREALTEARQVFRAKTGDLGRRLRQELSTKASLSAPSQAGSTKS